ncbi:CRE-TTR-27 protein [Aphelenchoides avenae]|nr:CRE-TTR-27 protein [Aphelenchus avenae]
MRRSIGLPRLLCCIAALSVAVSYVLEGNAYHNNGSPPRDDSALRNFTKFQSAGIQGRLLCNGKPIKKAMRLVATVGPPGFDGDGHEWKDGLYENEATDDGTSFHVSGWAPACRGTSLGHCEGIFNTHLDVFHRCNERKNRTSIYDGYLVNLTASNVIHFYISVPSEYVFNGKVPAKIWDIGTFDLANTTDHSPPDGQVPYWFNGGEVEGGCSWVNRTDLPAKCLRSDKHEEIPKWKFGEEFP